MVARISIGCRINHTDATNRIAQTAAHRKNARSVCSLASSSASRQAIPSDPPKPSSRPLDLLKAGKFPVFGEKGSPSTLAVPQFARPRRRGGVSYQSFSGGAGELRLRGNVDQAGMPEVAATTFLFRTYEGVCGTNWVIIGEAASQSDPITENAVTAALRHAEEATALMRRYRYLGTIPAVA